MEQLAGPDGDHRRRIQEWRVDRRIGEFRQHRAAAPAHRGGIRIHRAGNFMIAVEGDASEREKRPQDAGIGLAAGGARPEPPADGHKPAELLGAQEMRRLVRILERRHLDRQIGDHGQSEEEIDDRQDGVRWGYHGGSRQHANRAFQPSQPDATPPARVERTFAVRVKGGSVAHGVRVAPWPAEARIGKRRCPATRPSQPP